MKKSINKFILKIFKKLGIKSARTKNISKHILASYFYKIGGVFASFLLVPITLDYLDTENYGIWLTLSSFIIWFSFFDVGLGHGLRNKLAEAKSLNKFDKARGYISTAYFTVAIISTFLFLFFLSLNFLVDWTKVFNTDLSKINDLRILMPIVFGFFCIQLVVKLITSVFYAHQRHSIQDRIQFLTQVLSVVVVWVLLKTTSSSLIVFGSIISVIPVLILFILNISSFSVEYKELRPRLNFFNRSYLNDIMGLGIKFFILQIASLIIFSTDNFIITQLFSPEDVVPYNLSFKYFSILTMAYSIILTPFWTSFTDAFTKKDFQWIKVAVKNVQRIWLFVPLTLILMIIFSNWFYYFWVGDKIVVPIYLSVGMALFVLIMTFNMIYVQFINGLGKLMIQLVVSVIAMILNIPLSIYFAKYLELGTTGVILATIICLIAGLILMPVQYFKLINNRAIGIWNK